jgi:hypothetical protein
MSMLDRIKKARLAACSATGEKTLDKVSPSINDFMRSFLNCSKLDNPDAKPEVYRDVVPIMESMIERGMASKMLVHAHAMGLAAGKGWKELASAVEGWGIADQVKAKALEQYPECAVNLIKDPQTGALFSEKYAMEELGFQVGAEETEEGLLWKE